MEHQCVWPGAAPHEVDEGQGQAALCLKHRKTLRTLIKRVTDDYKELRAEMPKPVSTTKSGRKAPQLSEPGHPAEWASDQMAAIAFALRTAERMLREALSHQERWSPNLSEAAGIKAATKYLDMQFRAFYCWPEVLPDFIDQLELLHKGTRRALGHTPLIHKQAARCPGCGARGLVSEVKLNPDEDNPVEIRCIACDYVMGEEEYELLARQEVAEIRFEAAGES